MELQSENAKRESARADLNFVLVQEISKALLKEVHASLRTGAMPIRTGERLSNAIETNAANAERKSSMPNLMAAEAEFFLVVSDIAVTVKDTKRAYDKARAAKAIALTLPKNKELPAEERARYRHLLYSSAFRIGDLKRPMEEKLTEYRESEAVIEVLIKDFPDRDTYQHDQIFIGNKVAEILQLQGKVPEALQYFAKVRLAAEGLYRKKPNGAEEQRHFATTRQKICKALRELNPPNFTAGLAECDGSIDMLKRLVEQVPRDNAPRSNLAISYKLRADLLVQRSGSPEAAADDLTNALQDFRLAIGLWKTSNARTPATCGGPSTLRQPTPTTAPHSQRLVTRRSPSCRQTSARPRLPRLPPQGPWLRARPSRSRKRLQSPRTR